MKVTVKTKTHMNKLVIILVTAILAGCSGCAANLPNGDFVVCEHKHDSALDFNVASMNDIEFVQIAECPSILRTSNGECPKMVKVIALNDNTIHWLTDRQFENYVCIKNGEN